MHRLVWTLGTLFLTTAVSAQSLVELARKEKERREKLEGPEVRTYTEVDLANPEGPLTQVTGSATVTESEDETGSGSEQDVDANAADPAQNESYWRDRLRAIDGRIRDFEQKLQSPLFTSNPRGVRDRQELERQLEEARAERARLLTEARRAGVPPGWLR